LGEPIVRQYLKRFPDYLKTKRRKKYLAKDPLDNLLNLGYEVLKHEILLVTILGHLDPFLGFIHSVQRYRPSLIYDLMEPFRTKIEEFSISPY